MKKFSVKKYIPKFGKTAIPGYGAAVGTSFFVNKIAKYNEVEAQIAEMLMTPLKGWAKKNNQYKTLFQLAKITCAFERAIVAATAGGVANMVMKKKFFAADTIGTAVISSVIAEYTMSPNTLIISKLAAESIDENGNPGSTGKPDPDSDPSDENFM